MMAFGTPAPPETPEAKPDTPAGAPAPAELTGDLKVAEGKAALAKMTSGDIDGWLEQFADSAVYRWNNGDSLMGKAAIGEYWKNRRTKDIKTITFSNDIWLSLKVNTPQNNFVAPGQWLMSWYKVDATYKATGKSMSQWIEGYTPQGGDIVLMHDNHPRCIAAIEPLVRVANAHELADFAKIDDWVPQSMARAMPVQHASTDAVSQRGAAVQTHVKHQEMPL